jgi:hypothetical protein
MLKVNRTNEKNAWRKLFLSIQSAQSFARGMTPFLLEKNIGVLMAGAMLGTYR